MAGSAEVLDIGKHNQETLPGDLAHREGLAYIEPALQSSIDCGVKGIEEKHILNCYAGEVFAWMQGIKEGC